MPNPALADRCIAYADRLGNMAAGTLAADQALHGLFVQLGAAAPGSPAPRYTLDVEALRLTLPAGYVVEQITTTADCYYWGSRVADDPDYPTHTQWGATPALAAAGAVLRMFAWRARQGAGA